MTRSTLHRSDLLTKHLVVYLPWIDEETRATSSDKRSSGTADLEMDGPKHHGATASRVLAEGSCGPSVRRAWHDTSCANRTAYLRAVELLYKLTSTNSLNIPNYMDFARIHNNAINTDAAHGLNDGPFLHWHRWFLYKYEQALQIVSGTCVTVPYWDWTKDSGKPYNEMTVLQPNTFGSTKGIRRKDKCVNEGIAKVTGFWTTTASGGCLRRYVRRRRCCRLPSMPGLTSQLFRPGYSILDTLPFLRRTTSPC